MAVTQKDARKVSLPLKQLFSGTWESGSAKMYDRNKKRKASSGPVNKIIC